MSTYYNITQVATYQDLGLEPSSFGQYCSVRIQFMPSYAQSNRMCYIRWQLGLFNIIGVCKVFAQKHKLLFSLVPNEDGIYKHIVPTGLKRVPNSQIIPKLTPISDKTLHTLSIILTQILFSITL